VTKSNLFPTYTRTLNGKGQVVIPKAERDRLGIAPETRLELRVEAEALLLKPIRERLIQESAESLSRYSIRKCLTPSKRATTKRIPSK
jgi:AbrB family looped-hinge helix DNA binding protein